MALNIFTRALIQPGGLRPGALRIRDHASLMSPARAIPATTGIGEACGRRTAPARTQAPKKNSHFMEGREEGCKRNTTDPQQKPQVVNGSWF